MPRRLPLLAVLAIAWPFMTNSPASAQRLGPYVKVEGLAPGRVLWVRSRPTVKSKRIGVLPASARHIRNLGCQALTAGRWCRIEYRGTRGWASQRYLAPDRRRRA